MQDRVMAIATGNALALVAGLMQRADIARMGEFANLLALTGLADQEAEPEISDLLCLWAGIVGQVADAADPTTRN